MVRAVARARSARTYCVPGGSATTPKRCTKRWPRPPPTSSSPPAAQRAGPVDHLRPTLARVGARNCSSRAYAYGPATPCCCAELSARDGQRGRRHRQRRTSSACPAIRWPRSPVCVTLAAPLIRTLADRADRAPPCASLTARCTGTPATPGSCPSPTRRRRPRPGPSTTTARHAARHRHRQRPGRRAARRATRRAPRCETCIPLPWCRTGVTAHRRPRVNDRVPHRLRAPAPHRSVGPAAPGGAASPRWRSPSSRLTVLIVYFDRAATTTTPTARSSFLDAVYYTTVTLSTTGYGDIAPVSEGARHHQHPARHTAPRAVPDHPRRNHARGRSPTAPASSGACPAGGPQLRDHTVVVGFGTKGRSAAQTLLLHRCSARTG